MVNDICIIGVRSEIGAGTRGASLGVDAIQIAALEAESDLFMRYPVQSVETENHLLFDPVEFLYAKRIKGVVTLFERVSEKVSETLVNGKFPILLAGDHSTAGGTIAGIRMAHPGARLGVIWIDAHADLHTPYTTPSGNLHGMPVATALGTDNRDRCIRQPDPEAMQYWKKLKQTGGMTPKVRAGDLVYIALRDYEREEAPLIQDYGLKVITVAELRQQSSEETARQALRLLDHCDLLYLSFDADSLDPTVSKGTGTPVKNGLMASEAEALIVRFMQHPKACCLEIAEVNPALDRENEMAKTAFAILNQSIQMRGMR